MSVNSATAWVAFHKGNKDVQHCASGIISEMYEHVTCAHTCPWVRISFFLESGVLPHPTFSSTRGKLHYMEHDCLFRGWCVTPCLWIPRDANPYLTLNACQATGARFRVTEHSAVTATVLPRQADGSQLVFFFHVDLFHSGRPQQCSSLFCWQGL